MFIKYLQKLNDICLSKTERRESQYLTFAIYGLINTIVPYFLWEYNLHDALSIALHAIASILCFILIFVQDWLPIFRRYFPLYWYFTLFYCLPFLSTYTLLNNNLSIGWTINSILALFLLSFLIDWLGFLVFLGAGTALGYFAYWGHIGFTQIKIWENYNYIFLGYMYFSAIIIGGVFARKKAYYSQEKENYLKLLSGSIAHELRTPLLAISMGIKAIKEQNTALLADCYTDPQISKAIESRSEVIDKAIERIDKINHESFTIIEMFLIKTKNDFINEELSNCSMQNCIKRAFVDYPLTDHERGLITWSNRQDFYFRGNEILMMHILFNLLKNSLYYIKEANKGKIFLSLYSAKNFNILRIKDTGKGISKIIIEDIFQKFYSKTKYGTGIGLSFCKLVMDAFGGSIECKSQEGEFTEFTLRFPKIEAPSKA